MPSQSIKRLLSRFETAVFLYLQGLDTGHGSQNIHFHLLNVLLHAQTLVDIHIGEATFVGADDAVGLACEEKLNGHIAHLSGIDTVTASGNTAALDMAQNGDAGIQVNGFFDLTGNFSSGACALGHNNHVVGEAIETGSADFLNHIPLEIDGFFRNQNGGCANSKTDVHGKIAGITTHDFHHGATLVGLHGIAKLVDTLNAGIGGRVEADAIICAADVVVDSGRDADDIDTIFAQRASAAEGTVTADGNDAVEAQELTCGNSLALTFLGHKFLAAGCVENCAAAADGMGNALLVQFDNVAGDKAVPATANAVALNTMVHGGTDNSADAGIHTGGVAAAGQDTNSFDAHNEFLLEVTFHIYILYPDAENVKIKSLFLTENGLIGRGADGLQADNVLTIVQIVCLRC